MAINGTGVPSFRRDVKYRYSRIPSLRVRNGLKAVAQVPFQLFLAEFDAYTLNVGSAAPGGSPFCLR
jgi:hypothetical protein